MRGAWTVVAGFLIAGCLGPAAPPGGAPPADTPDPGPVVDVLVTDDELVPIDGATVFVHGDPENHTTDAHGAAQVPARPGPFTVKAWAPNYYRNLTHGEAGPNGSVAAHVVLERRPDDRITNVDDVLEGYCWLALANPLGMECMSSPAYYSGPHAYVGVPLPAQLERVAVEIRWDTQAVPNDIAFRLRLVPNGTFDDGSTTRVVRGASPLAFDLRPADLSSEVVLGNVTLRIGSTVPPDWEVPLVHGQPYTVATQTYRLFQAPPNPSW